ncbi:zinc-finger domain-containing protein [Mucidula mucida]|nr:zinc-finger domain-containing protein [Mucidula mucida]
MFSHLLKAAVPKRALVSSPSFVRLSSTSAPTTTTSIPAAAQSPNYPTTWSQNQSTRPAAQSSPRFEQTVMETQPNPLSAMQLIADEPIRLVNGRKAVCDGGSGPLGHPKIFINLDQPGPRACGYCGLRFEQAHHHHHHGH